MQSVSHTEIKAVPEKTRRNDLDALRASAMLLGIVYHAALSLATGFPWFIQDGSSTRGMYIFQSAVHGFRMPMFFMVSGFFTAMLWKTKGLKTLVGHRFRRVLLPCIVGLFTVVPFSNWMIGKAMERSATQRTSLVKDESAQSSIWAAIRKFNTFEVKRFLDEGLDIQSLHPEYRITPIAWATLVGDAAAVRLLLDAGCDPNARSEDQNTALHAAAFLGRRDIASLLVERGADVNAVSRSGETPLAAAQGDLAFVPIIAGLLLLEVDIADVQAGRKLVIAELERNGAKAISPAAPDGQPSQPKQAGVDWRAVFGYLQYFPVFSFLWFLWFLWWYVVLFAIAGWLAGLLPWRPSSWSWAIGPWVVLVCILLTMLPISRFDGSGWLFGPDTSVGFLPLGHVFGFYAIFFLFGIGYYLADDRQGRLGRSWRWLLPVSFLLVFPVALEFTGGMFGFRDMLLPKQWHRIAAIFGQSLFAWSASLGCIGLFRACLSRQSPGVRYMSDASYWLYVTHLPLVIWMQMVVLPYPWPAWLKLVMISAATVALLLAIYHVEVRSTWFGFFLKGRRVPRRDKIGYKKTTVPQQPS
ncbi:MAG: acyltransferase family protein [Planctomycetota bacterium]